MPGVARDNIPEVVCQVLLETRHYAGNEAIC